MADEIKFTKGLKVDLPNLLLAEPGFVTDEERVYIGGQAGNVPLPNQDDLDAINASLSEKANSIDVYTKQELKSSTLEIGKVIDFHNTGSTSDFDYRLAYNNTLGRLTGSQTSESKILEQRDIVNNLTATVPGSALDAVQGTNLQTQINKIIFASIVINPNGNSYVDYTIPSGTMNVGTPFVVATNGDLMVFGGYVVGCMTPNTTTIRIYLNSAFTGTIRLNLIYKLA